MYAYQILTAVQLPRFMQTMEIKRVFSLFVAFAFMQKGVVKVLQNTQLLANSKKKRAKTRKVSPKIKKNQNRINALMKHYIENNDYKR